MNRTITLIAALALCGSFGAVAGDDTEKPAAHVPSAEAADAKTLPPVTSGDKQNGNSLSSTLERGMDNRGLSMEEKWDPDVIVCKRQPISGSRLGRKVCHSRGEWRAMRENGRELTRQIQRRDSGLDEQ